MPPKRKRHRRESKAKFREMIFGPPVEGRSIVSHSETLESRRELVIALDGHSDPRIQQVADMAADPHYGDKTVASIARSLGLSSKHIAEAYRDGKIQEGIVRTFKHLPEVMEDVAIDAKSKWRMCKTCKGSGVYRDPDLQQAIEDIPDGDDRGEAKGLVKTSECFDCSGQGKVRVVGDADARKLVFETAKLTGQRGPLVAQQFNRLDGTESFESLMSSARAAMAPAPVAPQISQVSEEGVVDGDSNQQVPS